MPSSPPAPRAGRPGRRPRRRARAGWRSDPSHGPGGTSAGSQTPGQGAVVEERVGAGDRLRRAAGTAVEEADVEVLRTAALGGIGSSTLVAGLQSKRLIPAGWTRSVVAVAVVVRRSPGRSLAEEGEQVGRVGRAAGRCSAGESSSASIVSRHRASRRAVCGAGQRAERVGEVVVWPGRATVQAQVAEHRHRRRRRRSRGRAGTASGPSRRGAGRRDQRVEVVERGAQVDEGGVRLAQRRRQGDQRAVERLVLGGDRAERLVGVRGQRREVVAALGDRAEDPRAGDEELARAPARRGRARRAAARSTAAPGRGTCRPGSPPRSLPV